MKRSQFVAQIRGTLLSRRDVLRGVLAGELSHLGSKDDDESLDDEAYFQVAQIESNELERIEITLQRIHDGRYGVCELCHGNIPLRRLEALPYSTFCIDCQRQSERLHDSPRRPN